MIKKYMNVRYRKLRSSLDSSLCQEIGLDDSKKTNTLFASNPSPATYETPKEPVLTLPTQIIQELFGLEINGERVI